MPRRFQFSLQKFDRKVGPLGHLIAGVIVGACMSMSFMLGRDGQSAKEWWPMIVAAVVASAVVFCIAGLLIDRSRD